MILVIINLTNPLNNSDILRDTMLVFSFFIFFLISKLYQLKRNIFTPGYAIYFIVVFLIFNIGPYSYIYNQISLDTILRNPNASIPRDYYPLYFTVFLILNILIFIFLLLRKKIDINVFKYKLSFNELEAKLILITSLFLLLPFSLLLGTTFKLVLVTTCTYFFINYLLFKEVRKKKTYIIGFLFSIIIVLSHLSWRFIAVEYVVPTIFAFIIVYILKNKSFKKLKISYLFGSCILIFSILFYGIISEMYKLGRLNSVNDLTNVLFNYDLLILWINRQLYRIVDIWSVLGGNIIEHTNQVGYYYGITYIKVFANLLRFEYISLPKISADMVGANYAQPGLLAEGYANFGILGSVISLFIVFFIAEVMLERFYNNQNMFNLMLLCVPFTKVLIDGGSLNSIIFSIFFCIITFLPVILIKKIKNPYAPKNKRFIKTYNEKIY